MPLRHYIRNPVRDDSGFAAAGARKYQERALGVLYCLALLRIEPFEEVHVTGYSSLTRSAHRSFRCGSAARFSGWEPENAEAFRAPGA